MTDEREIAVEDILGIFGASYVELWLTPAEARRVLDLLDADHESNQRGDELSKTAGKKIWRHLADLGLAPPVRGIE